MSKFSPFSDRQLGMPSESTSTTVSTLAFYGRYSTDKQRDTTIDDQLSQCRKITSRLGGEIHAQFVFSDEGISGTSAKNRPALQELLTLVRQPHAPFTGIVIADTSRLARNLEEMLHICKVLKHYGIYLHIASTGLDSRIPGFDMMITFAGMMDEQFVDGVRDKSRRGAIGSLERGFNPGGKCYGYRYLNVIDPTRNGLHGNDAVAGVRPEINPEQAKIVVRIFEMYASGKSYAAIAKQLNAEGIKPPGTSRSGCIPSWSHTGVREMLFNERYQGRVIWGRKKKLKDPDTGQTIRRNTPPSEWHVFDFPALRIVSEELWVAAHAQNQRKNQKGTSAKAGGMTRTEASRRYIFSGCLQCGLCGASMVSVGKSNSQMYYGCPYNRFRGVCKNGLRVSQKHLESKLLGRLAVTLRSPEYMNLIAEEFERQLAEAQAAIRKAAVEIEGKQDELRRERSLLAGKAANLADGIAIHGVSKTLSAQLYQTERRIEVIDEMLKTRSEPEQISIPEEQITKFLNRKAENLVEVLLGEPERAKQEVAARVDKLILTPQIRDEGPVFIVSGDFRIFGDSDVMPYKTLPGLVGHYKTGVVTLDGLDLEAKLSRAA